MLLPYGRRGPWPARSTAGFSAALSAMLPSACNEAERLADRYRRAEHGACCADRRPAGAFPDAIVLVPAAGRGGRRRPPQSRSARRARTERGSVMPKTKMVKVPYLPGRRIDFSDLKN